MDARDATEDVLERAKKEQAAGNYRGCVELLRPLLERKEKLSPQQEFQVVSWLSTRYRVLGACKAALPHAQRGATALRSPFVASGRGVEGAVQGAAGTEGFPCGAKGH